jgi:hypothetical protein
MFGLRACRLTADMMITSISTLIQGQRLVAARPAVQRAACSSGPKNKLVQRHGAARAHRTVAKSVAARAPSVNKQWETEVARAALEHLKDQPQQFATGMGVLDSII